MSTEQNRDSREQSGKEASEQPAGSSIGSDAPAIESETLQPDLWRDALSAGGCGCLLTDMKRPGNPIVYCNTAFEKMSGYTAQEVIGRHYRFLEGADTDQAAIARIHQAMDQGDERDETLLYYRKDGTPFWNRLSISALRDKAGEVTHYVSTLVDISDSKQAESTYLHDIEALHRRLENAMRETHHRVKNSLQVLLALLDMRVMEGRQAVSIADMVRLEMHIHALAGIHDLLTQQAKAEGQAISVSIRSVLENLLPLVQQMSGKRPVHFNIAEICMPAQQATSLAFVINELVSNALKYGSGKVTVTLEHVSDDEICVRVSDDGPGFPLGADPRKAAHTGLELVEHLTKWDLRGKTRYENRPEGGASVTVIAPLVMH